jgi:hypothetical protein
MTVNAESKEVSKMHTRMPGFSGETSLYSSNARFRTADLFAGAAQEGRVVASLARGGLGFGCSCSGNYCCCCWNTYCCCSGPGGTFCGDIFKASGSLSTAG